MYSLYRKWIQEKSVRLTSTRISSEEKINRDTIMSGRQLEEKLLKSYKSSSSINSASSLTLCQAFNGNSAKGERRFLRHIKNSKRIKRQMRESKNL